MLYIIVGPTGSGKTNAACQLSDYFNKAKIINLDAFQIYKEMNVGTAKISKDSPYYDRHLLIDFKKPDESYSIKEFQEDFRKTYDSLKNEENIIAVGGSGLYLAAAIYEYKFNEENDDIDTSEFDNLDNETLYKTLQEVDPLAADKIHPNNKKRVIRALVIAKNGSLKSDNEMEVKRTLYLKEGTFKIFFINPDRKALYENINLRVDEMIKEGLVDEVKYLISKYDLSLTASQAIGYKEIISYLNGEMDLDSAIELIKKRSRNYAKRQITFFKHQFDTVEVNDYKEIMGLIKNER